MEATRTVFVWMDGERVETIRGLSVDEADHIAAKNADYGYQVEVVPELLTCPEDCDEGCYDRENFAAAFGAGSDPDDIRKTDE